MFGDEHTYVQEHQSQLLSYVNRCVPGPLSPAARSFAIEFLHMEAVIAYRVPCLAKEDMPVEPVYSSRSEL